MTSLHRYAIALACPAALLLATPASAALIKPGNTSAAMTFTVDLDSDVLTVTGSGTLAVSNDSAGHCSGSGTTTVTCDHLAGMTVQGGSGGDTFEITLGGGNSGTHGLTVRGRKGGDAFTLSEAESGDLTILGDADQDAYTLANDTDPVTIGQTAVVDLGVGSGDANAGETYTIDVTVNGILSVYGTMGPDTFDVDGTVEMTAEDQGGHFTVRTRGGADTADIDVTSVDGSMADQTAGYRASFFTVCGNGDDLTVTDDVSVTEKASYYITCSSGADTLDMSGVTVTVDGNGNTSEGGYAVLDGGPGSDTLTAPAWVTLSNGTYSVTSW